MARKKEYPGGFRLTSARISRHFLRFISASFSHPLSTQSPTVAFPAAGQRRLGHSIAEGESKWKGQ